MPGYKITKKRKITRRRKRRLNGGSASAEMQMREAIDYFFQIVTKQYNDEHPEKHITPPDSYDLFNYIENQKLALKKKTHTSRTGISRTIMVGGNILEMLLGYVFGPSESICEKLMYGINVCIMSIYLVQLVPKCITLMSEGQPFKESISTALADPTINNSIADPLRWAYGQIGIITYVDEFLSLTTRLVSTNIIRIVDRHETHIGNTVGTILQKALLIVINSKLYNVMITQTFMSICMSSMSSI